MIAPLLLDVFCGAGGAAEGYRRAGFKVIGIDAKRQPAYPFPIYYGDALEILGAIIDGSWTGPWGMPTPAVIHASPPCQAYSDLKHRTGREYPDLVPPVRELLEQIGLPYVIENVEGAPLREPITLCGTMFPGLRVLRHRLFESNLALAAPAHPPGPHPKVFTTDKRKAHYGKLDQDRSFVTITGGGELLDRQRPRRDGDRLDEQGRVERGDPARLHRARRQPTTRPAGGLALGSSSSPARRKSTTTSPSPSWKGWGRNVSCRSPRRSAFCSRKAAIPPTPQGPAG